MNRIVLLISLSILVNGFFSQQKALLIKKAIDPIELDGVLSENSWKNAFVADDFYQVYPSDSIMAIEKTKVMMCFDDQNIYVAAVCMDNSMEDDFVVSSLRRDYSFPVNDAFAVFLDPFNDKTNGFSFSTNPFGVQREGLLESAGVFGDLPLTCKQMGRTDLWCDAG